MKQRRQKVYTIQRVADAFTSQKKDKSPASVSGLILNYRKSSFKPPLPNKPPPLIRRKSGQATPLGGGGGGTNTCKRYRYVPRDHNQNTNSLFLTPNISYGSSGEKLLKYQNNLPWLIISLILMTCLLD